MTMRIILALWRLPEQIIIMVKTVCFMALGRLNFISEIIDAILS